MIAKHSIYLENKFNIVLSELENKDLKNKQNLRTTSSLNEEVTAMVVDAIEKKKACTTTKAILLIAGVVQRGGTNKSARSNTSFSYEGLTLNAQELQSIVTSISSKGTNRQLARSLSNEIAHISLAMNIEGDLANQMRYDHPDLTTTEAVWCSNFQTTNPGCPPKVREWLVNDYKNRFNR
jgi:hypothetical protein